MKQNQILYNGIFHPNTHRIFNNLKEYFQWYCPNCNVNDFMWVGLITHANQLENGNNSVETGLIKSLESIGIKVVPVFNRASTENENGYMDTKTILYKYFAVGGQLLIEGLVYLQMLMAMEKSEGTLFQQAVKIFKEMNVPIFRPLISHMQNEEEWFKNPSGLSSEMSWAFTNNEMLGMIEPIIVGCSEKEGDSFVPVPIKERLSRFANRIFKWLKLRRTSNNEKKLAIMIHSAPCSGVEATIGLGAGLDVFQSTVNLLKALKDNGYIIKNIPKNGKELFNTIMEKKAYQDFRWTSVESIVEAGGVLHRMTMEGEQGYLSFFNELDKENQKEMKETWGGIPGEGMVYEGDIIITGVKFGNVTVMVQPKRGCYGSKCTGEVCKILHDPTCPPPHQYIATYRYIERIMKAGAVIHMGTGGSLEYLPGKINALSSRCWPDIVLNNLPNIYAYNSAIGVEGMITKRRNYAVIADHMPSCFKLDHNYLKGVKIINEYLEAESIKGNQREILKNEMHELLKTIPKTLDIIHDQDDFLSGVTKVRDLLVQTINNNRQQQLHVLGQAPEYEDIQAYIKESIEGSNENIAAIKNILDDDVKYHDFLDSFIAGKIYKCLPEGITAEMMENLKLQINETMELLTTLDNEINSIINALEGKYVEPGMAGIPGDDLRDILPTGRNFYLMDTKKIPTKEAYMVGSILAEQLIQKYTLENGCIPQKVAMNMISTDISMTKGEQVSQVLNLMGIAPTWNKNGNVTGLEPIPLTELQRPRIDILVRITGVLRDSYPNIVDLMDQAVIIAANLNEATEDNFVRKNTLEILKALEVAKTEDVQRRATIRIFGDKPGTYGAGVDLALKASAWNNEVDIAKVFTAFSGYAYGNGLKGMDASKEFVENVGNSDVSYEKTSSKRYDILTSSFSASVQGGFESVKKGLSGESIKQYHGSTENKAKTVTSGMEQEIKRTMNETFFNPLWNDGITERGYNGASELMRRIQSIFEWQCLTNHIEDNELDQIVENYINDEKMSQWFKENNPYAREEISRRFLELYQRKRWNPDPGVFEKLKRSYVEIEGDMEEMNQDEKGESQGGTIEILTHKDIDEWGKKMKNYDDLFNKK